MSVDWRERLGYSAPVIDVEVNEEFTKLKVALLEKSPGAKYIIEAAKGWNWMEASHESRRAVTKALDAVLGENNFIIVAHGSMPNKVTILSEGATNPGTSLTVAESKRLSEYAPDVLSKSVALRDDIVNSMRAAGIEGMNIDTLATAVALAVVKTYG
jgi:hypothetical protein